MSFIYPLPTTGTISFSDYLLDEDHLYLNEISEATAQRGRVRAVLKEANKTEGPKDYTKVMKTVDDYLPYLFGIVDCLEGGQLKLKKELETSWRCTLSDSVLKKKRVVCRGIYYELIFTLMTYGYACSNWASSVIEKQLQKNEIDDKLKQAADILRRASGVFLYISEKVCPRWIKPPSSRPPDVLPEISASASKIALADASSIAIRMRQTTSSLLAKLAIGVAGDYEMANGLIKSLKDSTKVCGDFRKYVSYGVLFHQSLGKKFLAKDAYDNQQNGKAVGFITESREVLHLLTKCKSPMIAAHAAQEYLEVNELYNSYVGINDTVTFQVVPSKADLQALIPGGRTFWELAKYTPPSPAFGPGVNRTSKSESGYILEGQYY
ncbi:14709_t:CDS:2 [Gigaspora margarita]|uniref:pH-response regulator protein palC n=2 Tax=Gigaspora margarita TaxID=4874 RepID=A0A8H3XEQ2_GIGMA|nr:ph-response regulator protein palc [Gigaspora margarita]CAG8673055.1 14709_t:CDS:2 [Gigaspora margarita]